MTFYYDYPNFHLKKGCSLELLHPFAYLFFEDALTSIIKDRCISPYYLYILEQVYQYPVYFQNFLLSPL